MKANGVTPRHICKKCYDEAYKEQTFQETERLKYPDEKPDYTRVDYDVGICDICERNQAVFKENGSAFYICEECYQEMMRQYNASRL